MSEIEVRATAIFKGYVGKLNDLEDLIGLIDDLDILAAAIDQEELEDE